MTPPADLRIRPARPEEQRFIRRLVTGARLDPTTLKWKNFLVAELDGEIVGCGQIKPYRNAPELGSLVVRKAWRKRGVGGALIDALLAKESGMVYLFCRDRLVSYYEQFGFEVARAADLPAAIKPKAAMGRAMGKVLGIKLATMARMGTRTSG